MKPSMQETQIAFSVIRELASLAATPNISQPNVEKCNAVINQLLERVVEPATKNFMTEASGLKIV